MWNFIEYFWFYCSLEHSFVFTCIVFNTTATCGSMCCDIGKPAWCLLVCVLTFRRYQGNTVLGYS